MGWVLLVVLQGTATAAGGRVTTVEEYFAELPERFDPAAAAGFTGVVEWRIEGHGTWHAVIRGGAMQLSAGPHAAPDVRFRMGEDELVGLANGELDGKWLYLTSRLEVDGSLALARRVEGILPSAR